MHVNLVLLSLRHIHFLAHLQMAVCMTCLVAILLVWLKSSVLTAINHDTPEMACSSKAFCSSLETTTDGAVVNLKTRHAYYSQVQGQMAITGRKWCDFVIYTLKNLSVERIYFDQAFWDGELLPKLTDFYEDCVGPEIVSPMHSIGLPVRNLNLIQ